MAISTETTINGAAPANPLLWGFLTADVIITSPAHNAMPGASFTITGTASCQGRASTGEDFDATSNISEVAIRLGAETNPFQRATYTGSGSTPWASWSFAVNTALRPRSP